MNKIGLFFVFYHYCSCLPSDKFVIPVCFYVIWKIPMDGCRILLIQHPSIGIFPYCVNKLGITNITNVSINAAINGHLELTLLKDHQRFNAISTSINAISTSNLEVHTNFGIGEFKLILYLDMVNLHLIIFEAWWILNELAFYCFVTFFVWKPSLT